MMGLRLFFDNPHTSAAAVLYVLAKVGAMLGVIWDPTHAQQWHETADLVESAAVAWGFLQAGDARPNYHETTPPLSPHPDSGNGPDRPDHN